MQDKLVTGRERILGDQGDDGIIEMFTDLADSVVPEEG